MRIKLILTMFIGLLCLASQSYSQSLNPLAQLVSIEHSCGDNGGSVEFELLGDPQNFTYYWAHGPITLSLQDLNPGIYTFHVKNIYGCEEEYEIEILDISQCEAILTVTNGKEPCIKIVTLTVTSNGVPIPVENLEISWVDNPNETGLVRYFNTNFIDGGIFICAEVSVTNMSEVCCMTEACTGIVPDPPCGNKKSKSRNDSGINSFTVYPNPFLDEIILDYNSSLSGEAKFSIFSTSGELIISKKWHSEKGNQVHSYTAEDKLLPGIYILKFLFPSGKESHKRIIRVASF